MRRPAQIALSAALFAVAACTLLEGGAGSEGTVTDARSDGAWVGTITTEGNVTTVVNESGSVWGGTATLVEEASIGVAEGADEYMFGLVGSIHVTDSHIYITDTNVPALRVYDLAGKFIRNIGRAGQGPGEYGAPLTLTTASDGRVFLYDLANHRVNVYSRGGDSLDTYPGRVKCCNAVRVNANGELWVPVQRVFLDPAKTIQQRYGVQAVGQDGLIDSMWELVEPEFARIEVTIPTRRPRIVPFSPSRAWAVAGPETVVVGAGDRYRYTVQHRGRVVRIVDNYWDPVSIDPEHIAWSRDLLIASLRQTRYRPVDWDWDGAEIPSQQPAFTTLAATATGQVWARRPGRSIRAKDCVEDPIRDGSANARQRPCWSPEWFLDVFDDEGRLLGSVRVPRGFSTIQRYFSVHGDHVVSLVEDEAGTIMVKRYRLVLPGEQ